MKNELDLDHLFWKEMRDNPAFRTWFLGLTKFSEHALDLVTDEKWHQRWYTDPLNGIHIENKPAHGKWEPNQAENYRRRATNRKMKLRYVDFQIVLIAPTSFIERWPREVQQFDIAISYEDISTFIPEFKYD
jgi:hypothetical protein